MLIVEEIGVIEVCGANVLEGRMLDALVDRVVDVLEDIRVVSELNEGGTVCLLVDDIGIVLEEVERVGIDGVVDVDVLVDGVVGVNVLVDGVVGVDVLVDGVVGVLEDSDDVVLVDLDIGVLID